VARSAALGAVEPEVEGVETGDEDGGAEVWGEAPAGTDGETAGATVAVPVGGRGVGVGAIEVDVPAEPGLGANAPVTGPISKIANIIRIIAGMINWRPETGTRVEASSAGSTCS
jgi:hypothetical protein